MRGKKAKAIRKAVYGDNADIRKYINISSSHSQIVAVGRRSEYQEAKKAAIKS